MFVLRASRSDRRGRNGRMHVADFEAGAFAGQPPVPRPKAPLGVISESDWFDP